LKLSNILKLTKTKSINQVIFWNNYFMYISNTKYNNIKSFLFICKKLKLFLNWKIL
jgi:ferric iron reductase protein FhuF